MARSCGSLPKITRACTRCRALQLLVLVCLPAWTTLLHGVGAQSPAWQIVADGRVVPWTPSQAWPPDSLRAAALDALGHLQRQGYLLARIDSFRVDSVRTALHATLGAPALVEAVHIVGASALDSLTLVDLLALRPGRSFDAGTLEHDARTLVDAHAAEGFHLVSVTVGTLNIVPSSPPRVRLTFRIDAGPRPNLQRVALVGAARTAGGFATRVAGLPLGMPLLHFDPDNVQQRLEETGIFAVVGTPVLAVTTDTTAEIQVPVSEAPPGAFDLAVGYERNAAGRGALVGSGHLALRNLFGRGRTLALTLNRAPGQVSKIAAMAEDPFVFGLPLSLGARFDGLQQDSTFGKRAYALEAGYRLEGRMRVFATITKEVTRPGLTGLAITGGRQRIPVATALFAGLRLQVWALDNAVNPRQGVAAETAVETGRKDRTVRVVRADTTDETTRLQQARLRASARLFIPTARRQTLVLGGETMLLRSRELDESDLFRFGGATSLRGYDEDRFLVPFAARMLVEYRYLLDAASHALAFFDLGYVDASQTAAPIRGFYPGFGIGFQLDTDAGRISITAAASTEAPSEVRAHLAVSLGL